MSISFLPVVIANPILAALLCTLPSWCMCSFVYGSHALELYSSIERINPRLTKLFFVTRLTKGVVATPSLDFPNQTLYEIDFSIHR